MKKREADFGLLFRHWLKANPLRTSCAFELKQTTEDSLPFSSVKEHQIDALMASWSYNGLLYKAPDDSRGIKPFDYFYLRFAQAYIVIRYPDCFVLIEPMTFLHEKEKSKRKSLTSARAREIAVTCVILKNNKIIEEEVPHEVSMPKLQARGKRAFRKR